MTELEALKWCISHGARVQFYRDGAVNLSYYPMEDSDIEVEAYGSTLKEAIQEAEVKAKEISLEDEE